jgi:asparagine synthase (glutamine-hydrolysing)
MCGITAIFAYRGTAEGVRPAELEAITERMRPRGPDAGRTWIAPDQRVGLGCRRLAIIDLSADGTQPLFEESGDLAIVFNGEIYNHRELRAYLERRGVRFRSRTDTEVLLHLYRHLGDEMLGLLRGMYAFVIWDARARSVFASRDPYGIKPLYFADDGSTIRFASTVKALLAGGTVSRERDPAGTAGFLLTGSVPEPFTTHESVHAVEAGTSFHVREDVGATEVRRHYSVASTLRSALRHRGQTQFIRPETLLGEFVEESVAYHLVADVPVGVFLSAGIDSSTLASIAARNVSGPLYTFTLEFREFRGRSGDEAPAAERFARHVGSRHTTRPSRATSSTGTSPRSSMRWTSPRSTASTPGS